MLRIVARLSLPGPDDAPQVAFDECDAGAFHRHVGAGAHGDADVGLGQCRRVVDAVAGHRDHVPFGLKPLDHLPFLLGQHLGPDLVDPEFPRHGLGGRAAVAREHDDSQALGVESPTASGADSLIGSAMPSRPAGSAVDRDEDDRLAVACGASRPVLASSPASTPSSSSSFALPIATALAVDGARTPRPVSDSNACAWPAFSPRSRQPWRSPRPADARSRAPGSRPGAGARTRPDPAAGHDGDQARLALGERSGLVDDQRVDLLEDFQRLGVLDQYARRRPAAGPDHDRHGRGQAEAHGQAMISTATALTKRMRQRGSGPKRPRRRT